MHAHAFCKYLKYVGILSNSVTYIQVVMLVAVIVTVTMVVTVTVAV